jgi:hypothetical protein
VKNISCGNCYILKWCFAEGHYVQFCGAETICFGSGSSFQNGAGSGCQIRSKLQLVVTVNITLLKNHKHFGTIYRLSNEYFIDIKMLSGYMKLRYGIMCLILRSQSRKIITTTAPAKSFGSLRLRLHSTWLTLTCANQGQCFHSVYLHENIPVFYVIYVCPHKKTETRLRWQVILSFYYSIEESDLRSQLTRYEIDRSFFHYDIKETVPQLRDGLKVARMSQGLLKSPKCFQDAKI